MKENFVIYNEEYFLIKKILEELKGTTQSDIVFVTDSEGHCIASTEGMDDSYLNSISSLVAGSIAAVNSIAQMLEIKKFETVLTESPEKNLYVSLINERMVLIVIFEKSSNLGIVRLKGKQANNLLKDVFVKINEKLKENSLINGDSPFEGVSDEDIDQIFGD
ncbi:MAG: roadblock/LC7 domain-containing protein [Acidobacteriota bacterium]